VSLLLDENLSPKLLDRLRTFFPQSQHVETVGLRGQDDAVIWDFAKANGLTIVSKDSDFRVFSFIHGPSPKVMCWM
jgi:predicted nuclease of predicted toxin-antitoxin system